MPQSAVQSPSANNTGIGTETPSSATSTPPESQFTSSVSPSKPSQKSRQQQRKRTQGLDYGSLEALFTQEQTKPSTDTSSAPPSSPWYILTTANLLAFHKEKLIGELWTYLATSLHQNRHLPKVDEANDDDVMEEEKRLLLLTARRIREACLKASTLVGFPRAINALFSLTSAIERTHPSLSAILSSDTSLRAHVGPSEKYTRGMSFFSQIYKQHTARVLAAMDATSGGDLTHFAINCIYGELLSETSLLDGLETGLLEFVCCLADGCGPQAKG
ncbi:hypothetical protein A1O1_07536 [Capronia coronata CBS 617.96]|uniref:Uncharacterized protein n=1 Tax=Capronia coronata CBS 617.96 TaxID=1182541 RepID=W9XTP5_9EURO|nr:uncharacterized protein A1O1_07536 [Capronia coronata CBS 617.96]EXJ83907.1 hypothetical protein A1O1_07536 [Capronia coronata CBS 617.96]